MDEAVPPTHSAGDRGGPDAAGATRKNETGPNAAGATRHHCGSLRRRQSGPGGGPLRRSRTRTQVRPEACRLLKNSSGCPGLTASIPAARGVEAASLKTCRFAFSCAFEDSITGEAGIALRSASQAMPRRHVEFEAASLKTCRFDFSRRLRAICPPALRAVGAPCPAADQAAAQARPGRTQQPTGGPEAVGRAPSTPAPALPRRL
jgi:hypothetical protein